MKAVRLVWGICAGLLMGGIIATGGAIPFLVLGAFYLLALFSIPEVSKTISGWRIKAQRARKVVHVHLSQICDAIRARISILGAARPRQPKPKPAKDDTDYLISFLYSFFVSTILLYGLLKYESDNLMGYAIAAWAGLNAGAGMKTTLKIVKGVDGYGKNRNCEIARIKNPL